MGARLKFILAFEAFALLSWLGCTARPEQTQNPTVSEAGFTTAPTPQPGASATSPLPQTSRTAQVPATQANNPPPERTQPTAMPTAQDFASTIAKARQDLVARLGLDPSAIQFIQLTPDEFPADTLGCLSPGVTPRPIPAVVSGQVIILEARGMRYIYHARKEQVVFCGPWQ